MGEIIITSGSTQIATRFDVYVLGTDINRRFGRTQLNKLPAYVASLQSKGHKLTREDCKEHLGAVARIIARQKKDAGK